MRFRRVCPFELEPRGSSCSRSSILTRVTGRGVSHEGSARPAAPRGRLLLLALTALALLLLLSSFTATAFAQGGHIQGTVTDAGSTPLQGIAVTAYAYDFSFGRLGVRRGHVDRRLRRPTTSAASPAPTSWSVPRPAGRLHERVLYDQRADDGRCLVLWLDLDATMSGVDASLSRPCSISGVVTSAKTGDPLANVWVDRVPPVPLGRLGELHVGAHRRHGGVLRHGPESG